MAQALDDRPAHRLHGPAFWTPRLRRHVGRVLVIGFAALLAWLVIDYARGVDWAQVRETLLAYPPTTLAAAAAIVAASHVVFASYDLVGRRYAGHALATRRVLAVAFVCYAFNLNFGSLVGGVALRFRLYSRFHVRAAHIVRVIGLALATNWSGYLLLAGAVLATRQIELPASFAVGSGALQALGVPMLLAPIAYVVFCATARRREWRVGHHHFVLPGARMAALQVALGALNWALMGLVVWVLMPAGVAYGVVLATLLSAAILAVPAHIPGGLGVLEGTFVVVLGDAVGAGPLIAALIAYRALYFLVPLAAAAALYFALEAGGRGHGAER
jgi:uncharacterized membrane protein YbhN (UPF0104 family)